MTTEHKPHSRALTMAPFNGHEARKLALPQRDGSGSVWDVLAFQLLAACDHIEGLEEQQEADAAAWEDMRAYNVRLEVRARELQGQLKAARSWYGDHVTEDGIYDAQAWGDPFAVSNPTSGRDDA